MRVKPTLIAITLLALLAGALLGVVLQERLDLFLAYQRWQVKRWPFREPLTARRETLPIPAQAQGRLSLFILAGQSNMSGRGEVPKAEQTTHPQVFVFGNDDRWRLAREPIDDPRGQVDAASLDLDAGYSPAMAFAGALLEDRPDLMIGLIPCAYGGSSIDLWRKRLSDDTLYGSCLKRARAASTMGDLAGVLFFQGEADAMDPGLYHKSALFPHEWDARFVRLVDDLRGDLGRPDLPVVYAQIGTHAAPEVFIHWDLVQERQRLVDLPGCAMITTDDLPLADAVHFTPAGYRAIGRRYAAAYLALIDE